VSCCCFLLVVGGILWVRGVSKVYHPYFLPLYDVLSSHDFGHVDRFVTAEQVRTKCVEEKEDCIHETDIRILFLHVLMYSTYE
jgi:hypothetical protein